MAIEKYVLNKHTLQYEKIKLTPKQRLFKGIGYLLVVGICSVTLFFVGHKFLPTPQEQYLENRLIEMEKHFSSVTNEFELIASEVEELQKKDAEVHRLVFGMDPLDESIWEGGKGGSEKYSFITKYKNSGELLEETLERIDKLKYKLSLQKKSLDTIYTKAIEREDRLRSIPSIKPIQEDRLKRKIRYLSGYGYRIHPIHKVKKFHKGIDFTAPTGTPIQATGNGVVKRIEKKRSGYGYNVIIDHGYGFQTLYAHMHTIDVKRGEKVSKGHQIGTVGNTGSSTAPHLHYEVRKNGKAVNPIDYCMDGLSIEEYHELVIKAESENVSID